MFFTKNCKNSKNSETTSIKSPINLSANWLPFLEAQRLFFDSNIQFCLCYTDFDVSISNDSSRLTRFFSIKSRMEACPRLDMFPQPSFVCAQESSSLGLAVKKLIRVRQLTFFFVFLHIFCFIYFFFVPSVTIQ